jgi:hypothetical protein
VRTEANPVPAWNASGPLRIGIRKYTSTRLTEPLYGSVADVQVYDRSLVQHDFTGQLAEDPDSGGFDEPGMFQPIEVGRWDFDAALSCYDITIPDACSAVDGTQWGRRLRLSQGTFIGSGNRDKGAVFDDVHLIEDPTDPLYGTATREYGLSQRNVAPQDQPAQWQDSPVLRTDQSFTVALWVNPDRIDNDMTAIAATGGKQSAFYLGARRSAVDGVTGQRFEVMIPSADQDLGEVYAHVIASTVLDSDDIGRWTHLAVVYDAAARQVRLYVNGDLAATAGQNVLWNAGGPLAVGSAWATPDNAVSAWTDQWFGGIDDIGLYQGAMNSAQISSLFKNQGVPTF